MSRSRKKNPFMAICGNGSAKKDKTQAHRGERAAHKRAIHKAMKEQDYDVLLPHKHECSWNEVYSWGRDGNQMYQVPSRYSWNKYCMAHFEPDYIWYKDEDAMIWPPKWFVEMMRK
jgi:hypothetical protein